MTFLASSRAAVAEVAVKGLSPERTLHKLLISMLSAIAYWLSNFIQVSYSFTIDTTRKASVSSTYTMLPHLRLSLSLWKFCFVETGA